MAKRLYRVLGTPMGMDGVDILPGSIVAIEESRARGLVEQEFIEAYRVAPDVVREPAPPPPILVPVVLELAPDEPNPLAPTESAPTAPDELAPGEGEGGE